MKFDLGSAKILTPKNIELDMLSIRDPGTTYFKHNHHHERDRDWRLELVGGTFKDYEVPYLRGMAFKITDSFTTFLVLCYAVETEKYEEKNHGKYKYLICQDVDNLEFLEHANCTDKYRMVFDFNYKGELPLLEEVL